MVISIDNIDLKEFNEEPKENYFVPLTTVSLANVQPHQFLMMEDRMYALLFYSFTSH